MSNETSMLDAMATALAGLSSLSLIEGIPTLAEMRPNTVYLNVAEIASTRAGAADLSGYARRMDVDIVAAVPANGSTPSLRLRAAINAAVDIRAALETDPDLGGTSLDLEVAIEAVDGDQHGAPGLGVAMMAVRVTWMSDGGAIA